MALIISLSACGVPAPALPLLPRLPLFCAQLHFCNPAFLPMFAVRSLFADRIVRFLIEVNRGAFVTPAPRRYASRGAVQPQHRLTRESVRSTPLERKPTSPDKAQGRAITARQAAERQRGIRRFR